MKNAPPIQPVSMALSALAEPVRLRMLRVLEIEELSVGEVAKIVQLPQSTVSRHLKMLSDVSLVVKRSVGTATLYSLLLDDLPDELRPLWLAIREQLRGSGDFEDDAPLPVSPLRHAPARSPFGRSIESFGLRI